jgi:hypothetical protein
VLWKGSVSAMDLALSSKASKAGAEKKQLR